MAFTKVNIPPPSLNVSLLPRTREESEECYLAPKVAKRAFLHCYQDFPKAKVETIQLRYIDTSNCLIQRCTIHIDRCSNWQNKMGYSWINFVDFFDAFYCNR